METVFLVMGIIWALHFLIMGAVMRRFGHDSSAPFVIPLFVATAQSFIIYYLWTEAQLIDPSLRIALLAVAVIVGFAGGFLLVRKPDHAAAGADESGSALGMGALMGIPGLSVLTGMVLAAQDRAGQEVTIKRKTAQHIERMRVETDAIWDAYEAPAGKDRSHDAMEDRSQTGRSRSEPSKPRKSNDGRDHIEL